MKIDFILCTKDRPEAISSLLENINSLDDLYLADITVVDSSSIPIAVDIQHFSSDTTIKLIRSEPGLPTQRNIGLRSTRNPVIVFLDDDVVLAQNFITVTLEEFSQNIEIAGLGYLLKGVQFNEKKLFKKISSQVKAKEFGQVTRTGMNYWYPEIGDVKNYNPPMWLPGCAMAFRRTEIVGLQFNPVLEEGILGGYALGEDVDFTLSIHSEGKRFRLCQRTIVNHYEAPGERDNTLELARAQGHWLNYLTKSHKHFVRRYWVLLRLILEFTYLNLAKYINRGNSNSRLCSRERLFNFLGKTPYSKNR
jgi:GT2 family glycosyltransferase